MNDSHDVDGSNDDGGDDGDDGDGGDDDDDGGDDDDDGIDVNVYADACAAFCRGRLALAADTLDLDAIRAGRDAGLRLHRFKRSQVLPRVQRIIGAMRGLHPQRVLDVGTGRGALLWPLLDAFPHIDVTCVDLRADRVADLQHLHDGGFTRVHAVCGAIETFQLDGGGGDSGGDGGGDGGGCDGGGDAGGGGGAAFDVAIASEVLEHVVDERKAAQRLVQAARFVLVTVPSVPDDNPEHIRLFTAETLRTTFMQAGAARVSVDGVRGHFFAVVTS